MDVILNTEQAVFNYRVAGILIDNGYVLLHKLAHEQQWSLPGGRVAMGEESSSSLKREFVEELNMNISIDRLVWIAENFFHYAGKKYHEIGLYYTVKSEENPTEQTNSFYGIEGERLVFKWFPLEGLGKIELYPEFLKSALSNLPPYIQHVTVYQK